MSLIKSVSLQFKISFIIIIGIIVTVLCLGITNETKIDTVIGCKVIDLQQQQIIKGSGKNVSTEIRYLVVTDKETFICESSIVNGKFNNSDVFFHLKKDSTYSFKVCGYGKSFLFNYRNILEVLK